MKVIAVNVRDKIAYRVDEEAFIVCGNSDYVINFDFDADWNDYNIKTARFTFNGSIQDVVFEGTSVNVPPIYKSTLVTVGVTAGDIRTSTSCVIPCIKSGFCEEGPIADPAPDVYQQITEMCSDAVDTANSVKSAADNGDFDGEPGYTPVRGKDYWTLEDKAEIIEEVAAEIADEVIPKIPTKVSQLDNDSGYLTEHQDISGKADKSEMVGVWTMLDDLDTGKADKTVIETFEAPSFTFEFSRTNNSEMRLAEVSSISFTFGNGEYPSAYTSGLSFDSGATPTAIDYTDSGILNWVGTDCTNVDGLSIFQPSANTHYDIVFYFNGVQFIGLVNGFVPATGNEAV